jgi:hypothetical protein
VTVVAAGMHATVVLRPIRGVISLVNRQGIHICPQPYRGAVASFENPDHTGLANVAMDLTGEFGKLARDERRCSVLLEAKLGMCVQVLSCRQAVISP